MVERVRWGWRVGEVGVEGGGGGSQRSSPQKARKCWETADVCI